MGEDEPARDLEQEVARGQSEKTPVVAISSVAILVLAVFVVALALAVIAYVLA
jgi:hypothetical protein